MFKIDNLDLNQLYQLLLAQKQTETIDPYVPEIYIELDTFKSVKE